MSTFRPAWQRVAFVSSAAAGAIHLGAVRMHMEEYAPAGAFMLGSGIAQIAWALWVAAGAPRLVLRLGLAANAAIIALWFASRTTGLPWGPEPGVREHVHGNDAVATGLELLIVMAAYALASRPMPPPEPVALRFATLGALATLIVTGDDPTREPLIAVAALTFASVARALLRAHRPTVLIDADRRNHEQAPLARRHPAFRARPRPHLGTR